MRKKNLIISTLILLTMSLPICLFADGKFSLQMSRFCESDKCIFRDLNPEQNRK